MVRFSERRLDTLPSDQQQIVNSFYDRQVADLLTAGIGTLSKFQTVQAGQLDQNRKNIKGLALAFSEYADSTDRRIREINTTQQELKEGLQSLNDRVGKTEDGIAFLQNAMFSKLSPAEQLAALKSGMGPRMSAADRDSLELKISVVAKRQELVDRVSGYLNGAQELTNIAHNLGVDPEILQKANNAVAVGQNAVAAFTAFSSGNYLAAISSVSNIFGVGAPDVAGERHREIMSAFNAVFTRLDVMDRKLNKLLEGQQMIMRTQVTILENINALASQVQANQDQLVQLLHDLHNDLLYNRQLLVETATEHYYDCHEVVFPGGLRIIDSAHAIFPSYARFSDLFRDERAHLTNCMRQISETRNGNLDFKASVFSLESYKDKQESYIGDYLKFVFQPAFTILTSAALSDTRTPADRVTSLFAPMETVTALNTKLSAIKADSPARFKKPVIELIATALAVPVVLKHDDYACDVHYYYLFLDGLDQERALSDLYRADNIRMSGRERLLEALSLTDVAIAQQTMLSGDALLPLLIDVLSRLSASANKGDKAMYDSAVVLLERDSVLAQNLVLFGIRNRVQTASNFSTYAVAIAGGDKASLQSVIGGMWSLTWSGEDVKEGKHLKVPKGWSVAIGDAHISLPTPEALLEGRLKQSDEVRQLLWMRARVLDELSGYGIYLSSPAGIRRQVNEIILEQMAKVRPAA